MDGEAARVHERLILELNCVYGQRFPGRRAGRSARRRAEPYDDVGCSETTTW
jgi:hypothetical protein